MPDDRISQVRFEALAFRPWPWRRLICSVLSSQARACRRNHQVPRVPLLTIIEKIAFIEKTGEEEAAILEKIGQRWPRWHTDLWRKN